MTAPRRERFNFFQTPEEIRATFQKPYVLGFKVSPCGSYARTIILPARKQVFEGEILINDSIQKSLWHHINCAFAKMEIRCIWWHTTA